MTPVPRLSRRLGVLPGLRWLVDWRFAPFWPALISLAAPFLLALSLEWRVPNPLHQYKGAFPGDLFLSITGGLALYMAARYLRDRSGRWYAKWPWHAFALGFSVLFAASFAYGEIMNTIHHWVPSAAYTWPQIFCPTHLYHLLFTVPVFGYLLWAVVVPAWANSPWRFWPVVGRLVILAMIVAWVYYAFYLDNHLPRPDLSQVHGEWFGGHWRGLIPRLVALLSSRWR